MINEENNKFTTFCRMCDEQCCIDVYSGPDGSIERIDANSKHPWNQGRICSKGNQILDLVFSPDRITTPMKKIKNSWEEISLESALDEIAEKVLTIKEQSGAKSIGVWKGEAIGFGQQEGYARRFCHAMGSPNYFSCDSLCFASKYIGYRLVLGSYTIPDFVNSKFIVIWGAAIPSCLTPPSVSVF
jgi:anaerobic selenocysteine-containing dehydrogenase